MEPVPYPAPLTRLFAPLCGAKHSAVPELTGLQFDVNYDPSLLAIVSLQQEVRGEDGEVKDLEISPLETGHGIDRTPRLYRIGYRGKS